MEHLSNGYSQRRAPKPAVIIGAGPAGLTAAYELLTRTNLVPIVLEKSDYVGGLARTVNYKGNRLDIGGHRFFSKSERVMRWWLSILPLKAVECDSPRITYQGKTTSVPAGIPSANPSSEDNVMLLRPRKSRIYFGKQLFDYPITLSPSTLKKLGLWRTIKIGLSYLRALLFPICPESNLEQFFINRFGRELYLTFFKSYTEKVWGIACDQISATWGAQRVKGLSIGKTFGHGFAKLVRKGKTDLAQKNVETSLIEQFLYPKFGPGQMWEEVAGKITSMGGEIRMDSCVEKIEHSSEGKMLAVTVRNRLTGEITRVAADYFFSTMPIAEFVASLSPAAPTVIREISDGLQYRDFITVGLLCDKVRLGGINGELVEDNWIYIQDPDVLMGRLQIFNNWSPAMVADSRKIWLGLEYFCSEGDSFWRKTDAEIIALAKAEMEAMDMLSPADVLDATVVRMPKSYPAYFGSYHRLSEVTEWADKFSNLFLIGRNGMHKYNNQDHSMLAAMTAVDNIKGNIASRDNLWALNTEQDYIDEKVSERGDPLRVLHPAAARR
jgi:protoporphyrinogen oxidase